MGEEEKREIGRIAESIEELLRRNTILSNPDADDERRQLVNSLLACFPVPTTHREIPNGYSSGVCYANKPWLRVNTWKGPITIGWRKRVIAIDWSETAETATAIELFPDEDVTKDGKLIHAWGYEKARQYLEALLA